MNEAETRAELIDPALREAGWGVVDASRFVLDHYVSQGVGELDDGKLPRLLKLKYYAVDDAVDDAVKELGGVWRRYGRCSSGFRNTCTRRRRPRDLEVSSRPAGVNRLDLLDFSCPRRTYPPGESRLRTPGPGPQRLRFPRTVPRSSN